MHYTICAEDQGGRKLVVGEGFKGDSQADAAIRFIGSELGLASRDDRDDARRATSNWDPAGLLSG